MVSLNCMGPLHYTVLDIFYRQQKTFMVCRYYAVCVPDIFAARQCGNILPGSWVETLRDYALMISRVPCMIAAGYGMVEITWCGTYAVATMTKDQYAAEQRWKPGDGGWRWKPGHAGTMIVVDAVALDERDRRRRIYLLAQAMPLGPYILWSNTNNNAVSPGTNWTAWWTDPTRVVVL